MPSSKSYKRDYRQEYKTSKARGEVGTGSYSGNAKRHRARRAYEKEHGDLPSTVEVDHKKKIKDGGGNGKGNLRARPRSANRADNPHNGANHHTKKKTKR